MTNKPQEFMEKWRKEFEAGKTPQAIQRDAKNPDRYWNDPIQYQWEGFLHRCQTAVIELQKPDTTPNENAFVAGKFVATKHLIQLIESQGYRVEIKI